MVFSAKKESPYFHYLWPKLFYFLSETPIGLHVCVKFEIYILRRLLRY